MAKETETTTANFNTDELIRDYLAKNLKLEIHSKRHNNYDSKYDITIDLVVAGSPVSRVQFTI